MKQARHTPRLRFSTRVLLLQLGVVFAVVLMTAGTFAALTYQRLGEQAEARALAVARAVASSRGCAPRNRGPCRRRPRSA